MVKANNKIAKCVLACGVLVGVVSVSMSAMNQEEWDRNYADCIGVSLETPLKESKSNKNACQALINHSIEKGWGSLEQCIKDNCGIIGLAYYFAGRYREAIPYYEKAIASGNTLAYTALGNAYYQIEDYYNAVKYFKIECEKVNAEQALSCYNLGVSYTKGQGVRQDYHKAHELYKKACDMKVGEACINLGVLYYKGQGVRQNSSTAKQYFGKACDLGNQMGCDNYRELNNQGVQ